MTIQHHIDDRLLMAYSAGQLPEAFSLVMATHVSLCDDCRARLAAFDAVGGAMLEDCIAPIAGDSFEATMRRIAMGAAEPVRPAPAAVFPAPLRDYVGGDLAQVRWRPVGMGVKQAVLPTAKGATARLLYIPAGAAMPDHGHRGVELTLVLQGAFRDADALFARGDLEIADETMEHTPIAEPGEACICLAATDARLRFTSWLPRLAQPFVGI